MANPMSRAVPAGACLALLGLVWTACDVRPSTQSYSGATMGTYYSVLVESDAGVADTVSVGALVEGELARLERVLSTYLPDSDVSRFGSYRATDPMSVDSTLPELLSMALDVSRRSGGAFDPTIAPLVDAWGFGPDDVMSPDSETVAELLLRVGYQRLDPDQPAGTLSKSEPWVEIDLSGVAKGYAAERIAGRLAELGYGSALVDVGGELRALGVHVDGRPWRVAVEGPGADAPALLATIELRDEGIATSGDFRNYYEDDGVLYSHIIDPRTGRPTPYRGFSVSVVHANAALADAWATALTVLGPEEGLELATRESLAAVFSWRDSDGVATRMTPSAQGRFSLVE